MSSNGSQNAIKAQQGLLFLSPRPSLPITKRRFARPFPPMTDTPKTSTSLILRSNEIVLGELLGRGSFAEVYQTWLPAVETCPSVAATSLGGDDDSDEDEDDDAVASDRRQEGGVSVDSGSMKKVALKRARRDLGSKIKGGGGRDPSAYARALQLQAANDLANEVSILNKLRNHPNIISVHALSENFFWQQDGAPFDPLERFVVLDCLVETLEKRFERWSVIEQEAKNPQKKGSFDLLKRVRKTTKKMSKAKAGETKKEQQRVLQTGLRNRLQVAALPIAQGMAFLHEHGIISRDLKPANVGFDEHGVLKLFDFGTAVQLTADKTGHYSGSMTGVAGSYRYMAPEVFREQHYTFSADVYSFSMILYQAVTLEKPFGCLKDKAQVKELIVDRLHRPALPAGTTSCEIKSLLGQSWHAVPTERPTFAAIVSVLDSEIMALTDHASTRA